MSKDNTGDNLKQLLYNSLRGIGRESNNLAALHSISTFKVCPYNIPFPVTDVYTFKYPFHL